jgi:mannose-6-phosphate isomerase-like protein (cupin superfamily)
MQRSIGFAAVAAMLLLVGGSVAFSQNTAAPAEGEKRRFDKIERTVDMSMAEIGLPAAHIETLRVTLNPGTKSPIHKHSGRISVSVMVQGSMIEHRGDKESVEHVRNAGDVSTVPEGTTHWLENRGTVPVIYAETNLRPAKPQ